MDVFAVLVLFGLGIAGLLAVAHRFLDFAPEFRAVVAVGFGVGLAWLADVNMWGLWELPVRDTWIGVTLTGVAMAGIALFWHHILGYVGGLERKHNDEAEALEKTEGLRRVA
jgi:hypothetical protein